MGDSVEVRKYKYSRGETAGECELGGLKAVIQQAFIEQLLCARHSTEHWGYKVDRMPVGDKWIENTIGCGKNYTGEKHRSCGGLREGQLIQEAGHKAPLPSSWVYIHGTIPGGASHTCDYLGVPAMEPSREERVWVRPRDRNSGEKAFNSERCARVRTGNPFEVRIEGEEGARPSRE